MTCSTNKPNITEYGHYMTGSSCLFQCKPKLYLGYIINVLLKLFR